MKTEYVQTEFEVITAACRESYRIRGRARGVNLVPLAKGEKPVDEQAQEPEVESDPLHDEVDSLSSRFRRAFGE